MKSVLIAIVAFVLACPARGLLVARQALASQNCLGQGVDSRSAQLDEVRRLFAQSRWVDAPWGVAENTSRTPKPAFLFMIYERIVFGEAWEAFFHMAPDNSFALLIHSKMPDPDVPRSLKRYLMKKTVPTSRCHDTNLMLTMIGAALNDRDVTHTVMVSGDALPLRPLLLINRELSHRPQSRFCVDAEYQRAETWIMLNRMHADFLTSNIEELQRVIPKPTLHEPCDDEEWFFWPLLIRGAQLEDQCVMMTDWTSSTKFWRRNSLRCACPTFIYGSKKVAGSCARPSMFLDISERGLDELMGSRAGYWFLRKFPGDGIDGNVTFNESKSLDKEMAKRLRVAGFQAPNSPSLLLINSGRSHFRDFADFLRQQDSMDEFTWESLGNSLKDITPSMPFSLDSIPSPLGV